MALAARVDARPALARLWPGETFVCVGGGESLTAADVDFCNGKARVIAVNDAYRLAPWADVLYAADGAWWKVHGGVPSFTGLKVSIAHHGAYRGVLCLENTGQGGLELDPHGVKTGDNSGYQSINVAVHLGAARIVLLGFDLRGGHWFGQHPRPLNNVSNHRRWLAYFPTLIAPLAALGIPIINATRDTALECFPRQPLEDVFTC